MFHIFSICLNLSLLDHRQYAVDKPKPKAPPIPHFLSPAKKREEKIIINNLTLIIINNLKKNIPILERD